jgi:hypothetical protein
MNIIRSIISIINIDLLIVTVTLLILVLMTIAENLPQLSSVAWNNPVM